VPTIAIVRCRSRDGEGARLRCRRAEDTFRLHPVGAVVFATVTDGPTAATVRVFKVSEGQATGTALPEAVLMPCGVFQIPMDQFTF